VRLHFATRAASLFIPLALAVAACSSSPAPAPVPEDVASSASALLVGCDQPGPIVDLGWPDFRAYADANGDGVIDYCRFVGDPPNIFLSCQLGCPGGGFGYPYGFDSIGWFDQGSSARPRWLRDVNGDGRADFCRWHGSPGAECFDCDLAGPTSFSANQYGQTLACDTDDSDFPSVVHPFAFSASSTAAGSSASNAGDGSASSFWLPATGGSQWIQLDLGRTMAVGSVVVMVGQAEAAGVTHTLAVGQDPNNLRTVWTWQGSGGHPTGLLQFEASSVSTDKLGDVRYVRVTTDSSSPVALAEVQVHPALQYFGYLGDYALAASAKGTNLGFVEYLGSDHLTDLVTNLGRIQASGGRAMIGLGDLFNCGSPKNGVCDGNVAPPPCNKACASFGTQWSALLTALQEDGFDKTAVAFYIADEDDLTDAATRSAIQKAANYVQGAGKKTAGIFAQGQFIDGQPKTFVGGDCSAVSTIQSAFDWVGFDCYGPWGSCGMDGVIANLRSMLLPTQRMIAVPWAESSIENVEYPQSMLVQNSSQWQAEVQSDAKYVAVMPYAWFDFDDNDGDNAAGLPLVAERNRQFARSVLALEEPYVYPVSFWASGTAAGSDPFYAFDNDPGTSWTPGASAEYWVAAGFGGTTPVLAHSTDVCGLASLGNGTSVGGSTRVSGITLLSATSPSPSPTTFWVDLCPPLVNCYDTPSAWSPLTSFQGPMQDSQYVPFGGSWDVSGVRVRTSQGTATSGWREIHFTQTRPPLHPTIATGAFQAPGGDGYHLDRSGGVWHSADGAAWSLVGSAPATLSGGLARVTNALSNVDEVIATGIDGHLYAYDTGKGAWSDLNMPPGCDGVVGNPTAASGWPADGGVGIGYRCYNGHTGIGYRTGGAWALADLGPLPSYVGTDADPSLGFVASGDRLLLYTVGTDGVLYRCIAGSGCQSAGGGNYPADARFVGSPGVAVSQTSAAPQRWLLIADRLGSMWQFDGYNGVWTELGRPPCWNIEGDVSAAVDDMNHAWYAAVRCASEDSIAVYTMTPGASWRVLDTIRYNGQSLGKPVVTAQSDSYEGNVSFETSGGEQVVVSYVGASATKNVVSVGNATP
jgi:hypothetical protein